MGAYINQSDIEKRIVRRTLIQLTDEANADVNPDVVSEAISEAEGMFDASARAAGYALPVKPTQMVKSICLDIAVFKLYERRTVLKEGIFEVKEKAYDKAIKLLAALSSRKIALDVPAAEETIANPVSADRVLSGPATPATFSKEKLRGY